MVDVATLGLAVDSSGVEKGAKALDGLTSAATAAEKKVDTLGLTAVRSSGAFVNHGKAVTSSVSAYMALSSAAEAVGKTVANDNAFKRFAENAKLTSWEMRNLGFQVNDIGTMLAMGASPFQILASQGGQVAQILQGSAGGLKGFGAGLLALLTPMNLLAAGVVAVGAGTIAWMAHTVDATEALERHAEQVKAVRAAYNDLIQGHSAVTGSSLVMQEALLKVDRIGLQKKLADIAASLKGGIGARATAFGQGDQFSVFNDALTRLYRQIEEGKPKFLEFQLAMGQIMQNDPSDQIQRVAKSLFDLVDQGAQVERALKGAANGIEAIGGMSAAQIGAIRAFNQALGSLVALAPEVGKSIEAGRKTIDATNSYNSGRAALLEGLKSGAMGGREYQAQLEALNKAYADARPAIAGVTAEQKKLDDQIDATTARLAGDKLESRIGAVNNAYAKQVEDIRKMSATGASTEEINGLIERAGKLRDAQIKLEQARDSWKGGGGKSDEEKFTDIVNRAQGKIDLANREAEAVGMTEYAYARAKIQQELLNQARQAGIELTPQETMQLYQLADAEAKATVAKSQRTKQLQFEKDLTLGAMSTFRRSLMEGKGVWESFGDAANGVLDKVISKIENELVDAMFSANGIFGGGSGSAGGGLLNSIFALFSANGSAFNAGGVRAFAGGGAFTNSIVNSPTLFKFASGTGVMGEAGPEAIMPLRRDGKGRLGVMAGAPSAPVATATHISVGGTSITITGDANRQEIASLKAELAARDRALPAAIRAAVNDGMARGRIAR